MVFPNTPEDVRDEIQKASDSIASGRGDLRARQLLRVLKQVPHERIVEGVLQVFNSANRTSNRFPDQEVAGHILEEINPAASGCPVGLLKRCLPTWNQSIEQLPFWLLHQYGQEVILGALQKIAAEKLSAEENKRLKSMRWWVEGYRSR